MSLVNTTLPSQSTKDESQTSTGCAISGVEKTSTMKPPEQMLKCPRCDSSNTKFCYYNNYSLTQPRHFCKTCRRYWTKGGALRNVPIGGGCKKKKTTRSSSSRDYLSSLFTGLPSPAIDFQLNGLNQFSSTSSINPPLFMNLDSLRLKFPIIKQDHSPQLHGGLSSFQEFNVNNNLVSSIEPLTSINQDLPLRRASLFNDVEGDNELQNQILLDSMQAQKLQPIMFQNMETIKPSQTEGFFGGNYPRDNVDQPQTHEVAPNHGENVGAYENGIMNNWNNDIQGWNDFKYEYNAIP